MRCKINNCVKVLIYFIIPILQCEAFDTTENPVITLEYGKDTNNINTYYVEQNKSLQIIIKNSHAGYVRCFDYLSKYGTTFIEKEFPNNDKDSVINITSVTPDMSTRWACRILQKYHYFNLHVKGALSVSVSINGDSLNFTKTGLNVQHDGETFFSFIDHQNIELVCASVDKEIEVSLEYFNQNGEKILEIPPKRNTSILLRTRLTLKQDKFYIDCICHTNNKYRYRTYFYKQELNHNPDKQDNILIVTVNGLLERYVRRNGSYFDYPIFKYVDGEMIIVTCEAKRPYSSIPLQFYFDGNQVTLYNRIKVKEIDDKIVATINSSAVFLNKKTLSCGFNSRSEKEEYARITFESDVAAGTVRVFGLARSNILYQYRSGDVWTTVYQYSVNETISLGCVLNILPYRNYKFKWNFNGEESSRNGYRLSGTINYYADKNFIKTLTEQDDKKNIKCIVYENYKILNFAEIRLQLKEISNSENFEDQINPQVQLQLKDGSNDTDTSNNLIIIFACISGLVLTITVVGIVYWRKRIQRPKTTSNTEVPTSQPFYGNKMFQNDPNRGIYVLPENNDPKYEKASQAPCNRVKEDNEMTPIPESMYDSCSIENSTIQPNNDVPKSPDCSDPNHHHYEEVNYLQCKPKPSEPQQRSSKIYNVAYDHVRRCRSGK
ncbi:uncharacterized protein LOC118280526 isoform X2 [Spodoptera frugiperda]|uniref:Uncharacterized protein LOC118280526 isoform X2 n=1 Tax=Spodoptera frugiperda TaxID=7108 RepID=A0A9R0E365_SPOFR|nr:uncharacterized protein LOC118280526 isoform X2 [Spodoptera frugiperda]